MRVEFLCFKYGMSQYVLRTSYINSFTPHNKWYCLLLEMENPKELIG